MSAALERFNQVVGQMPTEHRPPAVSAEKLGQLPDPLAQFYRNRGYETLPSLSQMRAVQRRALLALRPGRPTAVSYTQVNSATAPMRAAYIRSQMVGFAFEGVDALTPTEQSMQGWLAKRVRFMNSTLSDLRQGNLHSILSELLIFPHLAFAPWVRWGDSTSDQVDVFLDPHHPGVGGLTVRGTLLFPDCGTAAAYHASDRMQVNRSTGSPLPWTARVAGFASTGGLHQPTNLSAHWHDEGNTVTSDMIPRLQNLPDAYFRSQSMDITYLH